ncbi:MAG: hypothetical protein IKY37_00980 [Bacteroidaceae bacterium]|nr:hypothetical protein [Bacteroidaceae bacterium]
MKPIKYIIALAICMLTAGSMDAQSGRAPKETLHIEEFLDCTTGIYCSNLNLNDFFSEAKVVADVEADESGNAQKIKISKCKATPSCNSDHYSYETAKRLLAAISKSIISNRKWQQGKNRCEITWKPRHNTAIANEPVAEELTAFVSMLIADETKKRMHKHDGSTFLSLSLDADGRIVRANHIGNIFWDSEGAGMITGVHVTVLEDSDNDLHRTSMLFMPKSQPPSLMSATELELYKTNKLLSKNAKQIANRLKGVQFKELAGQAKEICIEIRIDTSDIEVEESNPGYPGGSKAVKEYYTNNFRYNRILRRNRIEGSVSLSLLIKKNGKAVLEYIELREQAFRYEGKDWWNKVEKEITHEINRLTRKMPRWTPATYDGKNVRKRCSFRLRLDANK